jgi:hypothetical protein
MVDVFLFGVVQGHNFFGHNFLVITFFPFSKVITFFHLFDGHNCSNFMIKMILLSLVNL